MKRETTMKRSESATFADQIAIGMAKGKNTMIYHD